MNVTAQQGDTLDLVCWRELGRTGGVAELAFELNRDLADQGPLLAEGTVIVLPDSLPATPEVLDLVQLWD